MQCVCLPAFGQVRVDVSNQNFDTNKSLGQIKAEIEFLEQTYIKLEGEIEVIQNKIALVSSENGVLSKQIDSLNGQIKILDKQLAQKRQIERGIDSIKKQTEENRRSKKNAENNLVKEKDKENKLRAKVQTGEKYAKLEINNELDDVTRRRFSSVTDNDVVEIESLIEYYSDYNGIRVYETKLNKFREHLNQYREADMALKTPHGPEHIIAVRTPIVDLINKYEESQSATKIISKEQYDELSEMNQTFRRYKRGVNALKEMVNKINNDAKIKEYREAGEIDKCIAQIAQIIEKNDSNKETYEQYFESIPCLNNLLKKYWEELNENPLTSPTKTEEEINALWKLWYEA